jgi:hypothetical protein
MGNAYERYDIATSAFPDVVPVPSRFRVKVKRHRLLGMIVKETVETRFNLPVVLSRPCMYGVFGRKVGGMWPRQELCVGCLRCTVQYPGVVQIHRNPAREKLGDAYLTPEWVDTILYEARTGRVPVRGAGYRGKFGGEGWDGIWLDMSEIVRPTRDGIHGREFISTSVDVGTKPRSLTFDAKGRPKGDLPRMIALQVPFMFEAPPAGQGSARVSTAIADVAREVRTLSYVPLAQAVATPAARIPEVVPVVFGTADAKEWGQLSGVDWSPRMIALEGWDADRFAELEARFPDSLVCVRVGADEGMDDLYDAGVRVIHLLADHHGRVGDALMPDLVRRAHDALVERGVREEVTLIGSGGMVMAEHAPKAMVCGLDLIAIDTAAWVALQGKFDGQTRERGKVKVSFPQFTREWGAGRLRNQAACWRDQLLEVMGAMGLREVRRMRGEIGRAMFQPDVEAEAFEGIEGYGA